MITPEEALERLREGNKRFVAGVRSGETLASDQRRLKLVGGQDPFAVVHGCSDSRVPAEIVFDQGLGDLFVIRIAGNIVAPSHIGSIEYAVDYLNTPLVVVLGHTCCGAIEAALLETENPNPNPPQHLYSILDRVRPMVEPFLSQGLSRAALIQSAVRANVTASAETLRNGSPTLKRCIAEKKLLIVGAEYFLETGEVEFFDGVS